jgi:putative endonuclease
MRNDTGAKGEYLAKLYLEQKGFVFIRANYRRPCGEIDLILQENDEIVFVEVKTRSWESAGRLGRASDKIDREKQRRIWKTARCFLREEPRLCRGLTPRYDAVEVYLRENDEKTVYILHTPFAFGD